MKPIPLTQGKFAMVDDEDFDSLMKYKWCAAKAKDRKTWYALSNDCSVKPHRTIRMHRLIMGNPKRVDHADHNGLNNQKSNLRTASPPQNAMNRSGLDRHNTSGYRGVSYCREKGKWRARIGRAGPNHHLGYFDTPEEAARVVDKANKERFGEFHGLLNFPNQA